MCPTHSCQVYDSSSYVYPIPPRDGEGWFIDGSLELEIRRRRTLFPSFFYTRLSLFFSFCLLASNTLLMRMRFVFWIIELVGDQGKRERFWRVSWIIRNSFKLQKIISRKKIKFSYVCLQSALQFFRYLNTVCNCSITDSMRNERG